MTDFEEAARRAYAEGRREQRCPSGCGVTEAGGSYCTACGRPMHPDGWIVTELSEAQRLARRGGGSRSVSVEARNPVNGYVDTPQTAGASQ